MKVFVYFNLHRKCYSIKSLSGVNKGRVVAHAEKVLLRDATFKVSEAGRQRVLRTKRKNVHAGVVGTLAGWKGTPTPAAGRWIMTYRPEGDWLSDDSRYAKYARHYGTEVVYNPYLYPTFMRKLPGFEPHLPATTSPMVYLGKGEVRAFDPLNMPE